MTARDKVTLKGYFNTGDTIIEANLADLIDTIGVLGLTVAANNAPDVIKGRADYVCDGTDDQVEIQAALDALPAIGGIVQLSEGTFNLSAVLNIPNIPLQLKGRGLRMAAGDDAHTKLNITLSATGDMLTPPSDVTPQRFEGLAFIGDDTNTRHGINLNVTSFKQFVNILVDGFTTNGILIDSLTSQCWFENVRAFDSPTNGTGFNIAGVSNTFINCQAVRSSALGVGGFQGFKCAETGSRFIGIVVERHWRGFEFSTFSKGCILLGLHTEECETPLFVFGSVGDESSGCIAINAYSLLASAPADGAFVINACKGFTLINPYVASTTSGISITLKNTADTVNIIGGNLNDTTKIEDEGANRVFIRGIYGYVHENRGAQASVADGGTIAHGLSATPTFAQVQTSIASEFASVTALDATNITVAIKNDTGGAGTTQTIYWEALA